MALMFKLKRYVSEPTQNFFYVCSLVGNKSYKFNPITLECLFSEEI